eukprot:458852_1
MSSNINRFISSIQIGYAIDMFSRRRNSWIVVEIVNINAKKLKIHIYGSDKRDDFWIDKDERNLAPLNTYTIPRKILPAPKVQLQKPLFFHSPFTNERSIIIPSCTYDKIIDEYDIQNEHRANWNQNIMRLGGFMRSYSNHLNAYCIDNNNSILYIIGESEFMEMCLNTGYTNHSFCFQLLTSKLALGYDHRNSRLFECIDNRLHFIELETVCNNKSHLVYDIQCKMWSVSKDIVNVRINKNDYLLFDVKKILYIECKNMILIFANKKRGHPKNRIYEGC